MPRPRLLQRPSALRCPLCHEGLDEGPRTCADCSTAYHPACYAELGGCATLGCPGFTPHARPRWAEPVSARSSRPLWLEWSPEAPGALALLGLLLASNSELHFGIYLAVFLMAWALVRLCGRVADGRLQAQVEPHREYVERVRDALRRDRERWL